MKKQRDDLRCVQNYRFHTIRNQQLANVEPETFETPDPPLSGTVRRQSQEK